MTLKKPELLLPAGSLDRLKTAFLYGADAVYAGMPSVSLRNKTHFSFDEMKEGIDFAHALGKKVYLTMNLFTHNSDLPKLEAFTEQLADLNPDGVIIADPGVFGFVKNKLPSLPLHISTQANVCSSLTVRFWKNQGASLCVLGREVPLSEMKQIRRECPDIRLEMFVHGALCVSYSGRCLLSNFLTGRSANKGNCAHSCRWKYRLHEQFFLEEENRPGELMEITQDEHGTYIMNSKDLCLLPRLGEILPLGLDSFKIEGRNKSEYYAAVTARAYRHAIDAWFSDPDHFDPSPFFQELMTLQSRGYTVGFFDGNAGPEAQNYEVSASSGDWRFAGVIRALKPDRVVMELKHKIQKGMMLEFLSPSRFEPIKICVGDFYDAQKGQLVSELSSGFPGQAVELPVEKRLLTHLQPLCVARTRITK